MYAGWSQASPLVPMKLTYPTFVAAVTEAGLSRLYAGIRFSDDNTAGQDLGNRLGSLACSKAQFLYDGGLGHTTASRATALSAQPVSWAHSVDAVSNRLLLVGVATKNAATAAASVGYASIPLTRLGQQNNPALNNNRVDCWPYPSSSVRLPAIGFPPQPQNA